MENIMLANLRAAVHRARERAERRRAYYLLREQSDTLLRDIDVRRGGLYHSVMHGRDME
jgi:hypothetical protein